MNKNLKNDGLLQITNNSLRKWGKYLTFNSLSKVIYG